MPTALDTAGLRELGPEVLGRAVFSAQATSAIYVSKLKEVVDAMAAGTMGEGQARTALYEVLDALGYDVERGGFPGEELEPGIKGSIQDLRSFKRMDLVVSTQRALMAGAGLKYRGHTPDRLAAFPAWELVRVGRVETARDWPARFLIAFGREPAAGFSPTAHERMLEATGMIALKGDPGWGELGAWENFSDALGVDYPPFYYRSGLSWRERDADYCRAHAITGPGGETQEEWLSGRPAVFGGRLDLPTPRMSLKDVDPALVEAFRKTTQAAEVAGKPFVFDYSHILAESLQHARTVRAERGDG